MLFGKHINRYYIKHAPMLLLGILALVVVDYFQLKVPEFYKMVVNGLNEGAVELNGQRLPFDMDFLLDQICLPMIVTILALVVGRFLWRICFFGSAIKVETDLRGRMFDRCKDLSQQYYQRNKVGNMMSLFTNDLETVQDCFGSGVLSFFDALLLGGLALFKMARMNWLLTLLSMIPMVLLLTVGTVVGKYMMQKWEKRQAAFSSLSDFAQENFSGIAVIKAFVKEAAELWEFRRLNRENEDTNVAYTKASTLLHISVTLFVESVICIILGYGGYLVHEKVFTAGELVEFIGYFTAIVWPIMAISQLIEMQSRGKASLTRIGELLDAVPDVTDRSGVEDGAPLTGKIEFRSLTFRHPGADYDALQDVSFTIEAGENVGIIGKTGSGKTTVVDLILRTYNVPDGTVFLDGRDINSMPIRTVRRYAAYVPQDNFLFSDTIENNIAFASDNREHEAVEFAAKMADVHDNISEFSEGYNTVLGERGVTVSGGQKQRISIARALMKDAPMLILDDSVSAVDVKTEKSILENLRTLRRGKTTILIAHRISTVEGMDKILFFDDGRCIAAGTHAELLQSCEPYRVMVRLQSLEAQEAAANHAAKKESEVQA
ncbi:MAG: ABC transporter ATP-binding protein [Clostridia bacterium]|nr:ABC transporter ATP-binding protein [Clostridia bacterium]